jgi:hypothetical protein
VPEDSGGVSPGRAARRVDEVDDEVAAMSAVALGAESAPGGFGVGSWKLAVDVTARAEDANGSIASAVFVHAPPTAEPP